MLTRPQSLFRPLATDPQTNAAHWSPFLVKRRLIEEQITALTDAILENGDIRARSIVHPTCNDGIESLTPATEVTLNVLLPGETRTAIRDNANRIELCLQGEGRVNAGRSLHISRHDVWTIPPMQPFTYQVEGTKPLVWLSYANTALLRRLGAYVKEMGPFTEREEPKGVLTEEKKQAYSREGAPDILMPDGIARLRGYEHLTDIEIVRCIGPGATSSRNCHWEKAKCLALISATSGCSTIRRPVAGKAQPDPTSRLTVVAVRVCRPTPVTAAIATPLPQSTTTHVDLVRAS